MMKNNNLATIYLVRHGESEYNVRDNNGEIHISHQWGDGGAPLTKKGKQQAETRAKELKDIQFDAIFSSDLNRAKQTAEIIKRERQLIVQTTKVLRERRACFEEKTREENETLMIHALKDLDDKAKMAYIPSPEYESPDESATRILLFLREIAVACRGKTVLVTNHGNNMRNVLTHLGYAKYDELGHGAVKNTGYIILECDGVDFFVKQTREITKQKNNTRGW